MATPEEIIAEALNNIRSELTIGERNRILRRFINLGLSDNRQSTSLDELVLAYLNFDDTIDGMKTAAEAEPTDATIATEGHDQVKRALIDIERAATKAFAALHLLEQHRDQIRFWRDYIAQWKVSA